MSLNLDAADFACALLLTQIHLTQDLFLLPPYWASALPCGFWLSPLGLSCGMSTFITDHIL